LDEESDEAFMATLSEVKSNFEKGVERQRGIIGLEKNCDER